MLALLAAIAEFGKVLMMERQREGIGVAKAAERYKGRMPTVLNQAVEVLRLSASGKTPTQVAKLAGMFRL